MTPYQTNTAGYGAYKDAREMTTKTQQIVLLYEGIIAFLRQAKDAIEHSRIEERYQRLTKAGDVILGLQNSLDFKSGGDMAHGLYDFYSDQLSALHRIQSTNDPAQCDAVIKSFKDMLDAWRQIDRQSGTAASPNPTGGAAPMHPQKAAQLAVSI